jgi:DnaK suppressor protein
MESEQVEWSPGEVAIDRGPDLTILDHIDTELCDVEHALQRLDDGTYGTCEACGRPIGALRLEEVPAARFCSDHDGAPRAEGVTEP